MEKLKTKAEVANAIECIIAKCIVDGANGSDGNCKEVMDYKEGILDFLQSIIDRKEELRKDVHSMIELHRKTQLEQTEMAIADMIRLIEPFIEKEELIFFEDDQPMRDYFSGLKQVVKNYKDAKNREKKKR